MIIYPERRLPILKTWDNYKEYVKTMNNDSSRDIADIEAQAAIISEMIKQRNALGLKLTISK